ncbi:MAG: hypothetical protein ACOYJ2_09120, partial [Rickettsiales bacterium]
MRRFYQRMVIAFVLMIPVSAWAIDCASLCTMNRVERTRLAQEQPDAIEYCRLFSDPGPECIPRGRRMVEAPENLIQGRRASEETPDTTGAAPSVSNGAWQRSLSLP